MKSNSTQYFIPFVFFLLVSCALLIPGIYGIIYHESMLIHNHGKYVRPGIKIFLFLFSVGTIVASALIILIIKYRRVELDANGITILNIFKNKTQIPWQNIQYLRRAKWPIREEIIYKVKSIGKRSFYFRTDYQYSIFTKFKIEHRNFFWRSSSAKIDPTEMEKFIVAKKKEYNIKSRAHNSK